MGGVGANTFQWQINDPVNGWVNIPGATDSIYTRVANNVGTFQFRLIVTQSTGCETISAEVSLTVVGGPALTVSQDLTDVCEGGSAVLTAFVSGGTGSTSYQWQYNDSILGWIDITGAISASYVTDTLPLGTHEFRVNVAQDAGCDVVSDVLTVTSVADPSISIVAGDQSVCIGGSATLEVAVSGGVGVVQYQWQFQDPFFGWFDIAGATSAILVTPSLPAGIYNYRVKVSQASGCETVSTPMAVTVIPDPTVSIFTATPEICQGGTATVISSVSGGTGANTYQWQYFFPGFGWVDVVGETDPTFNAQPTGTGTFLYRLVVTQASGCEATSNTISVVVVPDPTVVVTIDDDEICDEGSATLTAFVSGGSGINSYQWQILDLVNGWVDVTGATSAVFMTDPLTPPGDYTYRVVVSQDAGCSATSGPQLVTVVADPVVDVVLQDQTVCEGGAGMFNAIVTGGTGTTTYQWELYFEGFGWLNVQGANGPTFETDPLTEGEYLYRVIITQDEGCLAASDTATVTVVADPTVVITATDIDICDQGAATLTADVTGGFGSATYQWQLNNPTFGWLDIFDANGATYVTPDLDLGTHEYRVLVMQNDGCDATSNSVFITVLDDPTVSIAPSATEICEGGSVSISTSVTGGVGSTTYQWQLFNGNIWEDIPGADSSTFVSGALAAGEYDYRLIVTQDEGCTATSGEVTISVVADPVVTVAADDSTLCVGGNIILTSTVSGGSGATTYQWQFNDGSGWSDILGANSAGYSAPALSPDTIQYRLAITQGEGCDVISDILTIRILPDPVVTVTAIDSVICDGATATLEASISGGTGSATYQWQINDLGWQNIPGATAATYVTDPLTVGTHSFRVVVTQGEGCSANSPAVVITVIDQPTATADAQAPQVCDGGSTVIDATVSGGTSGATYVWYDSVPGGSWTLIPGETSSSFATPILTVGSYFYRFDVTLEGGCFTTSSMATVTVVDDPDVTLAISDSIICDGGVVVIDANVLGGAGTSSYQWQEFDDIFGWLNIDGETASQYTSPLLPTGNYAYRVIVDQGLGCYAISDSLPVTVVVDPVVSVSGDDLEFCEEGSATLTAAVGGGSGAASFQWQTNSSGSWTDIGGATSSTYMTPSLTAGQYFYRVQVTQDEGCEVVSDSILVNVVLDPVVTVFAADGQICDQGIAAILSTVTGGTGPTMYQWQYDTAAGNWIDLPGAVGSALITPILEVGTHRFRLVVTQDQGCETISDIVTIEVVPDPTVTISTPDTEICGGGAVTMTTLVSGGSGGATYQWQEFDTLAGWQDIGGATNANYTTPLLTEGVYDYRVMVTQDSSCNATSDSVRITVVPGPEVLAFASDSSVCDGAVADLSSTVTGGAGASSYQWQRLDGVLGWTAIPGATSATYQTDTLTPGNYRFRLVVTQASGCAGTSNEVEIEVVPDPIVSVAATESEICGRWYSRIDCYSHWWNRYNNISMGIQ